MLEYFADSAPLDAITESNVFLSGSGVVSVILADGLAIHVEKALLAVLLPWMSNRRQITSYQTRKGAECVGIRC